MQVGVKDSEEGHQIGTDVQIAQLARERMQTSGYGGLHYGDIAKTLGITRAAVHHYFPNKVDLGRRVITDYCDWTRAELDTIDERSVTRRDKMARYVGLYRSIIERGDERLCPGGMLAAESMTLPGGLRADVQEFFDLHISWVARVLLGDGRRDSTVQAASIVASLQGALLVARLYGRTDYFDAAAHGLQRAVSRVEAASPTGKVARQ